MFGWLRCDAFKVPVIVVVSRLPAAGISARTTASVSRSRAYGPKHFDQMLCSALAAPSLHVAEQRFRPELLKTTWHSA